jgi:CBS domain-containing protein
MRVSTICTCNPVCVPQEMTARAAADEMHKRQVGSLIVIDATDNGRIPLGIVTDRDLVTRVMAVDCDPRTTTVSDAMTYPLVTCRGDTELSDAIRIMRSRGIRRLPVVDDAGNVVGLLAADDAQAVLAEEMMELARALATDREIGATDD